MYLAWIDSIHGRPSAECRLDFDHRQREPISGQCNDIKFVGTDSEITRDNPPPSTTQIPDSCSFSTNCSALSVDLNLGQRGGNRVAAIVIARLCINASSS